MSGIKSRKKLKITAEMAAEDSFRYGLWEECNEPPALDKVCFWYKFIKSKDYPTSKKMIGTIKQILINTWPY